MNRTGFRTGGLACDACAVRNRALCRGLSHDGLAELNRVTQRRRIPAGTAILHAGEPVEWVGIILSGAVKLVKNTLDGREQIVALQFTSEFVGHPFGEPMKLRAEAATAVELCSIPRATLEALMGRHPGLSKALIEDTSNALESAREWMVTLGRKSAEGKLASFLLHIADRAAKSHGCGAVQAVVTSSFDMPLSRTEIGHFLGLRIETVSRQFTALKQEGIIRTSGSRRVTILNMDRLRWYTEHDGSTDRN